MSAAAFSKQEALGHGFHQTQKFIGFILLMGLVLMMFRAGTGLMDHLAGKMTMTEDPQEKLDITKDQRDLLFTTLKEQGFVSEYGFVTGRLRNLESPDEIELPPALQPVRADIFEYLDQYRYKLPFPRSMYFVLRFVLWFVSILMAIGYIKICLMMSRDQKPELSELFIHIDLVIAYVLGSICFTLTIIGGCLLLIVPGIIFAIMFQMYSYLIVDKEMGPIASLKRSREITRGSRMNLAVLGLLLILINIAGLLCLGLGLIWSIPTTSIALAYVYDQLENTGGSGQLEDIIKAT